MPQTAPSLESNVRLPRAVREQAARVAQMIESRADPAAAPTPPANEPAIEAAAPSPEPAPPAAPVAPADPRENDPQYWAQRFRVTQGMLDRERRERVADQERVQREMTELREQLRTSQSQQPTTPSAIDVSQFFTPEQIEQYGQEQCETLASVALRAAREESQRALNERLKPLEDQRTQDVERAERQRSDAFWSALAAAVPDFQEVDATEGWKAWLSEDDPTTGLMRDRVLKQHLAAFDAPKVARIFAAYKATLAAPPPAPPVSAGNRAGPPAEPPSSNRPSKGYPTPTEIKDFYKRAATVRRGQPGFVTDQERTEFEARMQLQRSAA